MDRQVISITEGDEVFYCIDGVRHGRWMTTKNIKEATQFFDVQTARDFIDDKRVGWGMYSGQSPAIDIISVDGVDDDEAGVGFVIQYRAASGMEYIARDGGRWFLTGEGAKAARFPSGKLAHDFIASNCLGYAGCSLKAGMLDVVDAGVSV